MGAMRTLLLGSFDYSPIANTTKFNQEASNEELVHDDRAVYGRTHCKDYSPRKWYRKNRTLWVHRAAENATQTLTTDGSRHVWRTSYAIRTPILKRFWGASSMLIRFAPSVWNK